MYFIVKNESELGQRYLAHKAEQKKFFEFADKFLSDNGIESKEYGICASLLIVPTKNDIDNFGNQLKQPKKEGRNCFFRANSKTKKLWEKGIRECNIDTRIIALSDAMWGYIPHHAGSCYSIFDIDGVIYLKYESPSLTNKTFSKEDFTEIKASEFYKVIEDYNEKVKGGKGNE